MPSETMRLSRLADNNFVGCASHKIEDHTSALLLRIHDGYFLEF